jgi:hypothetical protein
MPLNIDPAFKAVTPSAKVLETAKLNAAPGQTPEEYIASRGGVNASGYYGDSWNSNINLTDEEYAAAIAGAKAKGLTAGAAINAAQSAKAQKSGADISGYDINGNPMSGGKYNKFGIYVGSTAKDANAQDINSTTSTSQIDAAQYNDRISVYASLADRFNKYGLTGLADKIKQLAMEGASADTISLQLQETPEYQMRFAANADRIKKGLSALSPAEYINVEDTYRQVLRAYGLNQFDNNDYVKQFISNDVSPTELSNRVVTAVQRVQYADPAISQTLKDFYGISSADIVAYVLDPTQQMEKIQRQVAAAEIGAAARKQGLYAGAGVSEALAAQGITQAEAQKGYATIADIMPTAEKLSGIYSQAPGYDQSTAEQDVFNSLASAQRKRQNLVALEQSSFSGSSGTAKGAFSTGYLSRQSGAGQF